ncbi:hypothetical protein BDW22DRAFT_1353075 [Trametopsis cervina]|nr:hypothetical protein BDW22DRAFT_1353075 [Trametopsis cervina]
MVAGRQITVRYYEPSIQEVFRTGFADSPLSAKQSHEGGGPVPASDSKSNSGTAQADARQKQQAAAFKRQMEAEEARIKAKREAAQARLKRRDERQRLKEVAQHNEQLARRRVEDALQEEYQANVEFVYTQSKCDKADKYLNESEQAAATAKRLWLEAMDREAEAVRQAQEAREDRAKSMSRKDYAETSRRAAEAHEWTFRRARERIEQEEEEEEEVDEETLRWLELEESIRKMEELRRIEKAGREEKAKQEKSKQDAEVAEEARKQEDARRQEEQRQAREREAAERIVREKREREEQERRDAASRELLYRQAALAERNRCLRRDLTSFPASANLFQWTPQLALDRFVFVSDEFDTINFGNTQPLTFESVPWPILPSPRQMTLEAIEWGAVERFFAAAAKIMDNPDEYRTVLAKARLRFHPDRWRGRGILNTVLEDELRNRLEAAGNIVAQAITPLWLEAKQQS